MGHLVQPSCRSGSPTARCTGPCTGRSWISPEKETPQPPWAACSSAPSPSEGRSSSSCSDGTSPVSVCAHCPLSCHWAPLERVWPRPPDTHPADIYKHLWGPLSAFSSSGWTSPAPSASDSSPCFSEWGSGCGGAGSQTLSRGWSWGSWMGNAGVCISLRCSSFPEGAGRASHHDDSLGKLKHNAPAHSSPAPDSTRMNAQPV